MGFGTFEIQNNCQHPYLVQYFQHATLNESRESSDGRRWRLDRETVSFNDKMPEERLFHNVGPLVKYTSQAFLTLGEEPVFFSFKSHFKQLTQIKHIALN